MAEKKMSQTEWAAKKFYEAIPHKGFIATFPDGTKREAFGGIE